MRNIIFYLGIATLSTHELDAMQNHEWRVFMGGNWLPEAYWRTIFLFAHVPLFAALVAVVASTNEKRRIRSRIGISIFLVFHGLLHVLFKGNANYEFSTISSNVLIFGGAFWGFLYLLLEFLNKRKIIT